MSDLSFGDPDSFKSGELRTCIDLWKDILEGYDQAENVLEWIGKGVNIREFMRPFRGSFMGVNYDTPIPHRGPLKTTTLVNSFRSLLRRHFYSASRLGQSVSGVGLGT